LIEALHLKIEHFCLVESTNLLFHLMVLLTHKGFSLEDVVKVLEERHKK